jgi:predicted anti-sigma-YlaC factor YlaD
MHREIFERLEDVLSGTPTDLAAKHLNDCEDCRDQLAAMVAQAKLVQQLKPPSQTEPRPGFYARVLERIEAEGPVSIWNLFVESAFGRRIALASFALAMLLGIYVVTAEREAPPIVASQPAMQVCSGANCAAVAGHVQGNATGQGASSAVSMVAGEDAPGAVLSRLDEEAPNDDMLVNLVTYREQ